MRNHFTSMLNIHVIINLNLTTSVNPYSLRGGEWSFKNHGYLSQIFAKFYSFSVSIFVAAIHPPVLIFLTKLLHSLYSFQG